MLLAAIVVAVWLHARRPPLAPDPLAIDPSEVSGIVYDGAALTGASPAFVAAAALPKRLSVTRPAGGAVAWSEPAMLKLMLRDGTTLRLQIMHEGLDDLVRVTADAPQTAPARVQSRAASIRALRLRAYRLPADSLSPILGEVTGAFGNSGTSEKTNKLIHKNKAGRVN